MTKDFSLLRKNLKGDITKLPKVKLALVGDTATQLLVTAIRGMGIECGYNLEVFEAEYNQVERQFFDTSSDLYQFDADYVLIFQSTREITADDLRDDRACVSGAGAALFQHDDHHLVDSH